MEYTEALMRELENLEIFEKSDSLTKVGVDRIAALRKCRNNFVSLHSTPKPSFIDWLRASEPLLVNHGGKLNLHQIEQRYNNYLSEI